jgi:hypothetical protein
VADEHEDAARPTEIIIVEPSAHRHFGHYAKTFAEVADGFVDIGCRVSVLTSRGWIDDYPGRRFDLHRFGIVGTVTSGLAGGIWLASTRLNEGGGLRRTLSSIGLGVHKLLWSLTVVGTARAMVRKQGLDPAGILVLPPYTRPELVDRLAGRQRWLCSLSNLEDIPTGPRRRNSSAKVGITTANPEWTDIACPYPLFPIGLATARRSTSDHDQLRRRLGVDDGVKVLLAAGIGHPAQRPDVIVEAVRQRDDIQLLIAGKMADRLAPADLAGWSRPPIVRPGHLDFSELDDLYCAADAVIVSIRPGWPRDSAVQTDAVSHATPMLVSAPSLPADRVLSYNAGEVFDADSAPSLGAAIDRLDLATARLGSSAMREDLAGDTLARRYLEAFASL